MEAEKKFRLPQPDPMKVAELAVKYFYEDAIRMLEQEALEKKNKTA